MTHLQLHSITRRWLSVFFFWSPCTFGYLTVSFHSCPSLSLASSGTASRFYWLSASAWFLIGWQCRDYNTTAVTWCNLIGCWQCGCFGERFPPGRLLALHSDWLIVLITPYRDVWAWLSWCREWRCEVQVFMLSPGDLSEYAMMTPLVGRTWDNWEVENLT